jgi:hypothetical protein
MSRAGVDQLNTVFTASLVFSGVRNYLGVPWLQMASVNFLLSQQRFNDLGVPWSSWRHQQGSHEDSHFTEATSCSQLLHLG